MATSTFDALGTAQDLEAAGIERKHAEAIAEGMRRAAGTGHDELATKADLAELKADLTEHRAATKAETATLKAEIAALRVEIRIIGALVLAIAAKLFGIFNAVAAVLA